MRNEPSESQLDWCRQILTFEIDEGVPELSFRDRLARENGWTKGYAGRVIDEYLRFVCLAMVSGHVVTPSDQVDQAWHLHLTYTRSYWDRLCGDVLKRPLHHGPTRSGSAESIKYHDLYERTLASYEKIFGDAPPADIWPPANIRFGIDLSHVRLNTRRHWVIPKPRLPQIPKRLAFACVACLLLFLPTIVGGSNHNHMGITSVPLGSLGYAIRDAFESSSLGYDRDLIYIQLFIEVSLLAILLNQHVSKTTYKSIIKRREEAFNAELPEFNPQLEAASLDPVHVGRLLGDEGRSLEVALTELTMHSLCRVSDDNNEVIRNEMLQGSSKGPDDSASIQSFAIDGNVIGPIDNLSPLAKATLACLPISNQNLEKVKKHPAFKKANQEITNDLIRQGLIFPEESKMFDLQKFMACQGMLSCSLLIPIAIILVFASTGLHQFILGVLVALSIWQGIGLCPLMVKPGTRRGKSVNKVLKCGRGSREVRKTDYPTSVAMDGINAINQRRHSELRRLHKWFVHIYTVDALTYGSWGC